MEDKKNTTTEAPRNTNSAKLLIVEFQNSPELGQYLQDRIAAGQRDLQTIEKYIKYCVWRSTTGKAEPWAIELFLDSFQIEVE